MTDSCDLSLENPKLLDPFSEEDCQSLACNVIENKVSAVGTKKSCAEKTIEVLKLNEARHIQARGSVTKTLKSLLNIPEALKAYIENSKPGYDSFIEAFLEENGISLEE